MAAYYTFVDTQAVNAAILNNQVIAPIAALQGLQAQQVSGTLTIAANGTSKTGTITFGTTLNNPPMIVSVQVQDTRAVTANITGAPTTTGCPVIVFTTAGNSVGSSAATYTILVTYIGS